MNPLKTITPIAFWYLRHGQTDWNAQNLAQGTTEIPLNETGLAQARTAAPLLVNRGITTIISSPIGRARMTSDIVADALGLDVEIEPDLREVNFGEMEGKPMLAQWFTDWIEGRSTPAGAESFVGLRKRAAAAVNRALDHQAPVLIVAHGALFRALRAEMGLDPDVRLANAIPLFCEPPTAGQTAWNLIPAIP
jgi:probable phosphoglycerate mutase